MDLFERYLHAVRGFLPKANQEDVVRELSEDLRSQAEEREAELGRPLTDAEQAEILEKWGHPLLLASRYQPRRHIIGPAVFPIYWMVLKVALLVTLLVHIVSTAMIVAGGRPLGDLDELIFRYQPFLLAFAWVTLVFALLERTVFRLPMFVRWDPASLPDSGRATSPSLACRIGEIAVTSVFVLWIAAVPHNQWLVFGPAWSLIELGPVWFSVHIAVVGLFCLNLIAMFISLRQADPHLLRSLTRLATNVCMLAILTYLLKSDHLLAAKATADPAAVSLAALLNRVAPLVLGIAVLAVLFEIARDVFRLVDGRRVWRGWSPFARQ